MISTLQSLSNLPGVRLSLLMTPDGVPIAAPGGQTGISRAGLGSDEALSALTAVWFSEVTRYACQVSWNECHRAVLQAARGTLVLQHMNNAVLIVLLARGTKPEDVRLAMEGTVARIERSVRGMGRSTSSSPLHSSGPHAGAFEPPAALSAEDVPHAGKTSSMAQDQPTEDPSRI